MDAFRTWLSRWLAPRFAPDVLAAADPLDPDPRVIARGVAEALRRCARDDVPVRLLVARVPGAVFKIGLDAVRRRCVVERADAAPDAPRRRAEEPLPPFTAGAGPAAFVLRGDTDNLRLECRPGRDRIALCVR